MKKKLLKFIECPECKNNQFSIEITKQNKQEIRNGKATCLICNSSFNINNGIINLLINPNKIIIREQNENRNVLRQKRSNKTDKWLLSLPLSDNFGNERYPLINKGYLLNLEETLNKFDLNNKNILDLGAGTCWTTNNLAKRGAECIALDISPEKYIGLSSADVYIKHNHLFFERVLSSMDALPFLSNSFDFVLANIAIHHSSDIRKTFNESYRVLKPNGRLIIVNEQCGSVFRLNKKSNTAISKRAGMDVCPDWNEHLYSIKDYLNFARASGLKSKIYFPPSIDFIICNHEALMSIQGYKRIIGQILLAFWQIPILRNIFKRNLFAWGIILFGGPIIIISKKIESTCKK